MIHDYSIEEMLPILWVWDVNASMFNTMYDYYHGNGVPFGYWDGVDGVLGAMGTDVDATYKYYLNGYIGRVRLPAPVTMDITAHLSDDASNGDVIVGVTPEAAMSGNYTLSIVIYQVEYTTTYHGSDFILPHVGLQRIYFETINLNGTSRVEVTMPFNTQSNWDTTQLGAAAFVRDMDSVEIQQGVGTEDFLPFENPLPERHHVRPFDRPGSK